MLAQGVGVAHDQDTLLSAAEDIETLTNALKVFGHCRSGKDGDCFWEHCPQVRDGESYKSGRHCPHDIAWADEETEW